MTRPFPNEQHFWKEDDESLFRNSKKAFEQRNAIDIKLYAKHCEVLKKKFSPRQVKLFAELDSKRVNEYTVWIESNVKAENIKNPDGSFTREPLKPLRWDDDFGKK